MRSIDISFPWLCQLNCGCSFTRIELTDMNVHRYWNPCGQHTVLAATGYLWPWPPTVQDLDREPVTV